MELCAKHIALLEQLAEKQRVTYGGVPDRCDYLERAGYVTTTAVNPSEILTAITDAGRRALRQGPRVRLKKPSPTCNSPPAGFSGEAVSPKVPSDWRLTWLLLGVIVGLLGLIVIEVVAKHYL
jgi:hypothetical protein